MDIRHYMVLVLCLFTISCAEGEQEPGVSTDESDEQCPEDWLQLYDVEHLMDVAVELEVSAQAYGVEAEIVDTSSPMPAACIPAMEAHAALEQENASVARQVLEAQSNDPRVTYYKIDGVLKQLCVGTETIQPPPGCIGGGNPRFEDVGASSFTPTVKYNGCSPAECLMSAGKTQVVWWVIGSVN